ncbi:MAG: phosphoribosylaminoimidazolesuccinocarboxamide synthase [Nitrospirota bacterium]|nr:phosphoribosylaminoimidazolesuccinocarboxamide synthase [Nitrospirota bacterium]
MEKRDKIYEGKAKILYTTDDPDLVIQYFKDEATAFDGKKKGIIEHKGVVNNRISERLFLMLGENGIHTHFVKRLNDREMLCKRLKIVQVEMIGRNVAAGSLAKRIGLDEGVTLPRPIVETYYKSDPLGDPMLCDEHIFMLELATPAQLEQMRETTRKINRLLTDFFVERRIRLVDFKVEYGMHKGELLLGDEICPDTCRLWDMDTSEKLDKDRFRRDLGKIEESYAEVARRVCGEI